MSRFSGIKYLVSICILLSMAMDSLANGDTWGNITGQFVYDGVPPKPRTMAITKNKDALGETVRDESLVVNSNSRGIANIFIYLLPEKGSTLRVHPSYKKSASSEVVLSTHEGRFDPHVSLIRTTQKLVLKNEDSVGYFPLVNSRNGESRKLIPGNIKEDAEMRFTKQEQFPSRVNCAIHPWTNGFVLIRDNPYMTKTDAAGRFAIQNLPTGKHTFQLWHELTGQIANIRIGTNNVDSKGRVTIDVAEGDNLLPATRLSPYLFENK